MSLLTYPVHSLVRQEVTEKLPRTCRYVFVCEFDRDTVMCMVARPQMCGFRRDLFALVSRQSAAIFSTGVPNFVGLNTHLRAVGGEGSCKY